MTKAIVLGFDGACWPLLEPWLNTGTLPTLTALRDDATWGPLTSQLPPVTSPNWRCYATGRNPGKLGVFWWEIVERQRRRIRHPTARDFHTRPLWHEVADAGKRAAIINFPTGYPPAPFADGRFTAGGPGAKDTGFAYPSAWEATLRERYTYRVHPTDVMQSAEHVARHLEEILALMQSRFDVAFDLIAEGIDFLHVTLFYINVLQHFCYRGEPTLAGWRLIDRNLGRIQQLADEHGYNLVLMSDHGCGPVETVFNVNTWLAHEGYLVAREPSTVSESAARFGLSRERLVSLARRSGLAPLLRRVVPPALERAVPSASGSFDKAAKGERLVWERSMAVGSGQGLIYLLETVEDVYADRRNEIAAKLADLRDPSTGRPVAAHVFFGEDVYTGPFVEQGPDIVFEQATGVHTTAGIGHADVFERPSKWRAENLREGLVLFAGPDFAQSKVIDGSDIVDLAPTLLHLLGIPIPDDVDGHLLTEVLAPQSDAARREVQYRAVDTERQQTLSEEEEAEFVSRLTDLGYLD